MFFDKALRMSGISSIQNALAFFEQSGRLPIMDCRRVTDIPKIPISIS